MGNAVSVRNLVVSHKKHEFIKDVSFEVRKGEIFALLGANGAGKTTILECIEGIHEYDSGEIQVDGKIGVQLQKASLPKNIKAIEAINLFAKWNNTTPSKQLLSAFHITEDVKKLQYKKMSAGEKRKLYLVLALINDPDVVFLDEPSSDLDVGERVVLYRQIRKLKARGKTVIFTSHDMSEVESLCDKIGILKHGCIEFVGTAEELTQEYGRYSTIYVKTINPIKDIELEHSSFEHCNKYYTLFKTENVSEALYELLDVIKKSNNTIIDVKVVKSTIEEKFMNIAREGE